MRGLGLLLVLVGVAYLVYTQGLPKLREVKAKDDAASAATDQARQCVAGARAVSRSFASDLGQFSRPPVDTDVWASFLVQTGGELSSADSACSCPVDACNSAGAALLELRRLLNSLDAFVRSQGPPVMDAANRFEEVDRLLARAEGQLEQN
jgi:hypothetical protein